MSSDSLPDKNLENVSIESLPEDQRVEEYNKMASEALVGRLIEAENLADDFREHLESFESQKQQMQDDLGLLEANFKSMRSFFAQRIQDLEKQVGNWKAKAEEDASEMMHLQDSVRFSQDQLQHIIQYWRSTVDMKENNIRFLGQRLTETQGKLDSLEARASSAELQCLKDRHEVLVGQHRKACREIKRLEKKLRRIQSPDLSSRSDGGGAPESPEEEDEEEMGEEEAEAIQALLGFKSFSETAAGRRGAPQRDSTLSRDEEIETLKKAVADRGRRLEALEEEELKDKIRTSKEMNDLRLEFGRTRREVEAQKVQIERLKSQLTLSDAALEKAREERAGGSPGKGRGIRFEVDGTGKSFHVSPSSGLIAKIEDLHFSSQRLLDELSPFEEEGGGAEGGEGGGGGGKRDGSSLSLPRLGIPKSYSMTSRSNLFELASLLKNRNALKELKSKLSSLLSDEEEVERVMKGLLEPEDPLIRRKEGEGKVEGSSDSLES